MTTLKTIWWKLYPNDDKHRWMPLIWLPFMIWFFVDPLIEAPWRAGLDRQHGSGAHLHLALPAGVFPSRALPPVEHIGDDGNGRSAYPAQWRGPRDCSSMPAAAGGFHSSLRRVSLLIALDVAILAFYVHRMELPIEFWGSMLLLIILVGFGNHYGALSHCAAEKLQLAQDEIEHLAKVAERERIARDMHDVLGHTLSLITLKAELARKLVDRDPERAKQEMQDVEHTSRAALAEVREAISGYRGEGLGAELLRARQALETAGIAVECESTEVPLSRAQESVLALALREAVTNVVRHAQAQRCSVRLSREQELCTLEIADNGRGADAPEGNGLRGMRERLEAIGGSLQRQTQAGTRLIIHLPLAPIGPALRN